MKMDPAVALTSPASPKTHPTAQLAGNIIMNITPSARTLERLQQRNTNHPIVNLLFLCTLLNTRISLQELFQGIPNLCHVLGDSRSAKKGQTSAKKLL